MAILAVFALSLLSLLSVLVTGRQFYLNLPNQELSLTMIDPVLFTFMYVTLLNVLGIVYNRSISFN